MSEQPTMTGWLKREMQAKARLQKKQDMAEVRRIRAEHKAREEGVKSDAVTEMATAEHESPTVPTGYPDSVQMSRDEMFAYLAAHGVKVGGNIKNETLRKRVVAVRDQSEAPDGQPESN